MNNKDLFDTNGFSHKQLLEKYEFPWEVIKGLNSDIDSFLEKELLVGKGTEIDPSVRIEGKAIIGKNCRIKDNVLIRDGCIIGDDVSIGHGCEIKHSVILNNTAIAHFNYVGDSVVGNGVNIGGGAIIANWRFDEGIIKIKKNQQEYDTGLEKFGAGIGDGVKLGSNCVVNPGTILGKNSWVFPLVSAFGVHADGSMIK